jgi:hypothetical protein
MLNSLIRDMSLAWENLKQTEGAKEEQYFVETFTSMIEPELTFFEM